MKEYDNSKIHTSSNFILSMASNNVGHLFTKTITTLQHFATLHPTTLRYTYRHFTSSHLQFTTLSYAWGSFHASEMAQLRRTTQPFAANSMLLSTAEEL